MAGGNKNIQNISAWMVRLAALVALLSVPLSVIPNTIESYLPYDPESISRIAGIIIGIALFYVSSQLFRWKRVAYQMALVGIGLLITIEFLHSGYHLSLILYAIIIALLIHDRHKYVVLSDFRVGSKIASSTFWALALLSLLVALSFFIIDIRQFGIRLSTFRSIQITIDAFLGRQIPSTLYVSPAAHILIDLIRYSVFLALLSILYALFRPKRLATFASGFQSHRAARILEAYSDSSEDYFKIWPTRNKHYFFYDDSFLCYGVKNNNAYVLDGCSGNSKNFNKLRESFVQECHINGWNPVVIHADEDEAGAWIPFGADKQYIGSEAVVNIKEFMTIENNKHFRYVKNKASSESLHVEFWQAPHTNEQIASLRTISDTWLSSDRREYEFVMGYFDDNYLNDCNIAVLYQNEKPIAFINFIPSYTPENLSIDHMRFTKNIPSISMHYLLLKSIEELHRHSIETLNLGLAPLSKLSENSSTYSDKFLQVIKKIGRRYYSFNGLEQFKNKFEPEWEPRYIVYKGTPANLPHIILGLNYLINFKDK